MAQNLTVDALVVGAGPAGSTAARLLAEAGHHVLCVEEDATVGEPMQCAGLVTSKVFRHVPIQAQDVRINGIRGARIHAPSGHEIHVDAGQEHAVVMDRSGFDRRLAEHAQAAGADVWTQARYVEAKRANGTIHATVERLDDEGRTTTHDVRTRLLIGADGVQSNVGRDFHLPRPREFLAGFEAESDGLHLPETDTIPMFTNQAIAPGFFSWIIPLDATSGRAGLCMRIRRTSARAMYDRFLRHPHVAPYAPNPSIRKPIVGTVPLGMPRRFTTDGVLLVGDAAAMPKPTSGGGIWTAVVAAHYAAEAADAALRRDDVSDRRLRTYADAFWRSKVGREVRLGWRLRRAFLRLTNHEIDDALRLLSSRRAVGVIDSFGDIDHPSHLIAPLLLAEPRLLKFAPKALRHAYFAPA